jgi:7-carboxy-7-deazaguanine synthase
MTGIRISEIFGPTVQGEGALIGKPTVFVRTGGCDFRCSWCDTLYAVLPEYRHDWVLMSAHDILVEITRLTGGAPILVTLSGGNPAIQPLGPLIAAGRDRGYSFAMETQGSVFAPWFAALDWLVLSPKPPSSGMATNWAILDRCVETLSSSPRIVLKIVVFDDADYAYAREVASRYRATPLVLQVGNHTPPDAEGRGSIDQPGLLARFRWLVERVTNDRWFEVTVLPQLHVLVWGNERGV